MFQKTILAATCLAGLLAIDSAFSQQPYYGPPPTTSGQCDSCNYGGQQHAEQPYVDQGHWVDEGQYFDSPGCDCAECVSGRFPRLRGAGSRMGGRLSSPNVLRGRPGDMIGAPCTQGGCGDCNLGPVYLSIFAGVSFIDNLDSRFTFDNGIANMLGVQETGFSTLDGVAAGGAIGRYFYRQARVEFEYTFRGNGVGDMSVFTFSDDLTTPQINDTLVSSVEVPAAGNIDSNSFMLNFVFDLKPRTVGCVNGYLGGGIGVLYVDGDAATAAANFNIEDTSLAFQGIAGINYPIRERVDLFTEYRYLGADSISIDRTDLVGTVSLGAFRFDSHSFVFGMRFLR